jgi:hypothetical protein
MWLYLKIPFEFDLPSHHFFKLPLLPGSEIDIEKCRDANHQVFDQCPAELIQSGGSMLHFWVATACGLIGRHKCFGGTLASVYKSTRRYISEDQS